MSVMRPVTGSRPLAQLKKESNGGGLAASLADVGVSLTGLFGWQKTAFRRVEDVSATQVRLDFDGRSVQLPRAHFPAVKAEQWVRFERQGDEVRVAVDLRATLRAESRLSDLFQSLSTP